MSARLCCCVEDTAITPSVARSCGRVHGIVTAHDETGGHAPLPPPVVPPGLACCGRDSRDFRGVPGTCAGRPTEGRGSTAMAATLRRGDTRAFGARAPSSCSTSTSRAAAWRRPADLDGAAVDEVEIGQGGAPAAASNVALGAATTRSASALVASPTQ
jgi:hypothetical protein